MLLQVWLASKIFFVQPKVIHFYSTVPFSIGLNYLEHASVWSNDLYWAATPYTHFTKNLKCFSFAMAESLQGGFLEKVQ